MDITMWIPLVVAFVSGALSIYSIILQNKAKKEQQELEVAADVIKKPLETVESITSAAQEIVELQLKQVENQKIRIKELEEEVEKLAKEYKRILNYMRLLRSGIKKLVKQIEDLDCEPVWTPEELPAIHQDED